MAKKKDSPLNDFLSNLQQSLFGTKKTATETSSRNDTDSGFLAERKDSALKAKLKRQPYIINIGFDFGTSFSKCVVRDTGYDRAHIFFPKRPTNPKLPFLLPTTLRVRGGKISMAPKNGKFYGNGYLPFVKMALAFMAQNKKEESYLAPYLKACATNGWVVDDFVMAATIFCLAKSFDEINDFIFEKFPDFGAMADDQKRINVSIPIFEHGNTAVEQAFNKAIKIAWEISGKLKEHDEVKLSYLMQIINANIHAKDKTVEDGAPFLYPEISAALQLYAQSNSFPHNIYVFSDVGAGTVDQAIFTYHDNGFSFLGAHVSPLGSSRLEKVASQYSSLSLEQLRKKKETGNFSDKALQQACNDLHDELEGESSTLIVSVRDQMLFIPAQIEKSDLIFSGGGYCSHPYERAVQSVFTKKIFRRKIYPNTVGMPEIYDLEFPGNVNRAVWGNRLHVAYGLSFPDYQLEKVKLPNEIKTVEETLKESASLKISGKKECVCRGRNPACNRCDGKGYISDSL